APRGAHGSQRLAPRPHRPPPSGYPQPAKREADVTVRLPGIRILKAAARPAAEALLTLTGPMASVPPGTRVRRRERLRTFGEGRVHLAMRGLRGPAGERAVEIVEKRLTELPSVRWAAANALLGSVVIATEGLADDEQTLNALIDIVEDVEELYGF